MTKDQLIWLIEQNEHHALAHSFYDCHNRGLASIGIHAGVDHGLRVFTNDRSLSAGWDEGMYRPFTSLAEITNS